MIMTELDSEKFEFIALTRREALLNFDFNIKTSSWVCPGYDLRF
jgi:hypothetical protein